MQLLHWRILPPPAGIDKITSIQFPSGGYKGWSDSSSYAEYEYEGVLCEAIADFQYTENGATKTKKITTEITLPFDSSEEIYVYTKDWSKNTVAFKMGSAPDSALSTESKKPLQNKAIANAFYDMPKTFHVLAYDTSNDFADYDWKIDLSGLRFDSLIPDLSSNIIIYNKADGRWYLPQTTIDKIAYGYNTDIISTTSGGGGGSSSTVFTLSSLTKAAMPTLTVAQDPNTIIKYNNYYYRLEAYLGNKAMEGATGEDVDRYCYTCTVYDNNWTTYYLLLDYFGTAANQIRAGNQNLPKMTLSGTNLSITGV